MPNMLVNKSVNRIQVGLCRFLHSSRNASKPPLQENSTSAFAYSIGAPSRPQASSQAGSSRPRHLVPSTAQSKPSQARPKRKRQQRALLRLDPRNPIVALLAPTPSTSSVDESQNPSQSRAKKLSHLHVALQTGSADAVWSVYLEARHHRHGDDHSSKSMAGSTLGDNVTPEEYRQVLNVIGNDATKTKRGLNRVLRLMSDLRDQQRHLLLRLQQASQVDCAGQSRALAEELKAWDAVISPKLFNTTIGLIGRSLRSVGLDEVDQILDQLLTYEANEQARMPRGSRRSHHADYAAGPRLSGKTLNHLHSSKLRGKQRQVDFPDLATYNTILDIITRTVHRSDPARRSAAKEERSDEEADDDAMSKLTEQHLASHSAQVDASLASKLRRFYLNPDAAPVHLDAHERADRLFHSVLERMQRISHIEPDHITFNIMITMYCLLDRWDAVHRIVRSADDKGLLNIDCVNNALGHWLVRGPASAKRLGNDRASEQTATDTALDVYRQLRQNLVHAELASHDSTIAYGDRDAKSLVHHHSDSPAELGPLSWPDSNERPASDRSSNLAASGGNVAIEATLGISRLPINIVPDEITHTLLINSLARDGRFADALSVFKDLVSTPIRLSAKGRKGGNIRTANAESADEGTDEKTMQPTLAIFDSFFRGFSRHGRPSTALILDLEHPERSTWEEAASRRPEEGEGGSQQSALQSNEDGRHAQQLQLWNIKTFQQIFDAFLNFEPDLSQVLASGANDRSVEAAARTISTPLGWLTSTEKRRLDGLRRTPSTNQLFWILTAIRRVSHDHAGWSLAVWQKVVDKFGPRDAATSSSHDGLGWIGFRLDNRLARVLEHLEARLAQEQQEEEQASDIAG